MAFSAVRGERTARLLRRILAIFFVMAVVAAGLGVVSAAILQRTSRDIEGRLALASHAVVEAHLFRAENESIARHARAFINTGEVVSLEKLAVARRTWQATLLRLEHGRTNGADDGSAELYRRIRSDGESIQRTIDDAIALRHAGKPVEAMALYNVKAKPRLELLDADVLNAVRLAELHHQAAREDVSATARNAALLIVAFTVFTLVCALVLGALQVFAVRGQKRTVAALAASEARHRFLAHAEERLVRLLDPHAVLAEIARLAVPELADGCAVHLLEDGVAKVVAVEHRDPAVLTAMRVYEERQARDSDEPFGVSLVLRAGRTDWMRMLPDNALELAGVDAETRALFGETHFRSYIVTPLFARGAPAGSVTLVLTSTLTSGATRLFSEEDVHAAEELARRASLHLDNALLFREQQRLADARAEAEQRYRLATRVNKDVIWDLDLHTRTIVWNEGLERLFGWRPEDVGADLAWWEATIHPDDRGRVQRDIEGALHSGVVDWHDEYRFQRRDGSWAHVKDRGFIVHDAGGRPVRMVGSMQDVTAAHEAEQQASLAHVIAVNATAALFMYDVDGHCTFMNPAAEAMSGYRFDELADRTLHEVIHHSRPDGTPYPIEECPIYRALHTGQVARGDEVFVRKDGSFYPVAFSASPILDAGRPGGLVLEVRDTTAEHEARRERQQMLEREMAARAEAVAANRLKDEFLATISHELRTPLMAVLGWVQMLRHGPLPPDRQARALETIERNARAQGKLIEDLLDVSRIISGKLRIEVQPVDLRKVVEAAMATAAPAAEGKGVRLVLRVHEELPDIMGDATRLQQVVWNLLSNAVKFTPGGGCVEVALRRLDGDGESVELEVRDTGEGIPLEILPHVFERFRQADGSTVRRHGGLGLGLAIVKNIVELHGGSVTACSEGVGRGARFQARLPVRAAARRGVVRSDASVSGEAPVVVVLAAPPGLEGLRVLVVDDEEDTRDVLKAMLEEGRARVTTAASASAALEAMQQEVPDVIVSDIGMPEEDGYSFMRRVRALSHEAGRDVPAIALTAYGRSEDRVRSRDAGFQAHLQKPIAPQQLLHVVAATAGRA